MPRLPDTSPQTLKVFGALLAEPAGWRYGYDLSRETGLASGTLYPILIRLAERDLVETRWEPPAQPGRPPRHVYRLTADGVAHAQERLAAAKPSPVKPSAARAPLGAEPMGARS